MTIIKRHFIVTSQSQFKTTIATHHLETKKDASIKKELAVYGLDVDLVKTSIFEYEKDTVMAKPFFSLPKGIGFNDNNPLVTSKVIPVNQHAMLKKPQGQADKKPEANPPEKTPQQPKPGKSPKGSCIVM
jgi:hypothetical protein